MRVFNHTYKEYSGVTVKQIVVDHKVQRIGLGLDTPEHQRFGYYVTATFPDGRKSSVHGYVETYDMARHAVYTVSEGMGAILGMVSF